VMAKNRYGFWREAAPVQLQVTQPFYRADWFLATCGLGFVLSAILAYKWRISGIRARNHVALMERTRMAREIHDTLLQGVAGASLVLEAIASSVENQDARQKFDRALDEMQLAMSETRYALWDMRATDEQASSLATRISQYGQSVAQAIGVDFDLELRGEPFALDAEFERQIFHIFREAILNATKHSGASGIRVTVEFQKNLFRLTVADNGRGFYAANMMTDGHWGLLGMQERAAALGGFCSVSSTPGQGTTVVTELPQLRRLRRRRLKTPMAKDLKDEDFEQFHGNTNSDSNPLRR
jgi:signal transduction histidine kinase